MTSDFDESDVNFYDFLYFQFKTLEGVYMKEDNRKCTTIRINPDIWEIAGMKAQCSRNELVERLLMNYIAIEGSRQDYEQKIKESEEIIRHEKNKIIEYKQAIKEIDKEEKENEENLNVINDCYKRIDRYMETHSKIPFAFIKTLNNTHKVSLNVLNKYVLDKGYKFM